MYSESNTFLKVAFLNTHGQTGLNYNKQLQIESFLIRNKIDVLNLQEVHISNDTFSKYDKISTSYNIFIQITRQQSMVQPQLSALS